MSALQLLQRRLRKAYGNMTSTSEREQYMQTSGVVSNSATEPPHRDSYANGNCFNIESRASRYADQGQVAARSGRHHMELWARDNASTGNCSLQCTQRQHRE